MDKVYSLNEAIKWFLSHSSGSVICVKDKIEIEVETYIEAEKFYMQ